MTEERVERRLAAILAADVEGYSRLMGADEVSTLRDLTQRRTILDGLIAAHRGRIANTGGDSVLAEFGSAVDAVQCAVDAQEALAEANAASSPERHINFRIGIHVGDVMVKAGDLFGDGVNIAARLQTIASPGGVCVSGVTYDQVRKILPFVFADLGAQQFKNIEGSVRAYSVGAAVKSATAGFLASSMDQEPLALPGKPSIAVLPFQNMSGDPEQEYFADGMVEDITTALSRIKWLFVIARNSSFTYKGKAVDIKLVGRELGVRYVLEGSVRKMGGRVRITGQLIDAATGTHLWADKFDGDLQNIFDLQDEITDSVVAAISPRLQQSEFERAKRKPTKNLTAYDYYLRGLAKMSQYKKEAVEAAWPLFLRAIELDPEFASPYAAASFWYGVWMTFGWSTNRSQDAVNSIAMARKALELDQDDAIILTYAGFMLAYQAQELDEAIELIERATKANPNLAMAWNYRAWVNVYLGEHKNAIEYFQKAVRLSPRDPLIFTTHSGIAHANFYAGNYGEALKWAERAIRENPEFLGTLRILMACNAFSGKLDAAKATWEIARRIDSMQRVSNTRQRFPLKREEDLAKLMEGFRLAGMPE